MDSREAMLSAIRVARGDTPVPAIERGYAGTGAHAAGSVEALDLLADRLEDYRATVIRVAADGVASAVAAALGAAGDVVVPPGLPEHWIQASVRRIDDGLSPAELDRMDAVVTACAAACATTGTIVLDGSPDQGRRAVTLVPDVHVCVVRAEQVVHTVPELVAAVEPTRPLTFVSGPSATSDIELQRVEGVHGPRTLIVLLVT